MKKADLIREINELQRKVERARRDYQLDIWMSLSISIGQLKSLFFISNQGSTNSKKLAKALCVTPTNVTGIVDRLVKQGLVDRTEDPEDRRVLILTPTNAGKELVANLRERKRSGFSKVLSEMSERDLVILHQGLISLVDALQSSEEK